MPTGETLLIAETAPLEVVSLKDLKETARNLLALTPDDSLRHSSKRGLPCWRRGEAASIIHRNAIDAFGPTRDRNPMRRSA